jgi:hypothetical protein
MTVMLSSKSFRKQNLDRLVDQFFPLIAKEFCFSAAK